MEGEEVTESCRQLQHLHNVDDHEIASLLVDSHDLGYNSLGLIHDHNQLIDKDASDHHGNFLYLLAGFVDNALLHPQIRLVFHLRDFLRRGICLVDPHLPLLQRNRLHAHELNGTVRLFHESCHRKD